MNNKEEKGKTLGEYQKKIKDLEQRLALMDADNSALAVELAHFKKVAAGAKGRNKQLAERVAHYKGLNLEGDELNEKHIAVIEEKNKVIKGLQAQVNELISTNTELKNEINAKQDLINKCELTICELQTPWWKKIFSYLFL